MKTESVQLVTSASTAAFWDEFNALPDRTSEVAFQVTSQMQIEQYAWLGDSPNVRKWVGSRIQKSVPEQTFTIQNDLYESTLAVDYFTHQSPAGAEQVAARSRQLAQKMGAHPWRLLVDLLVSNGTCYDSLSFFNDSHVDAGAGYTTTQDNNLAFNASSTTSLTSLEASQIVDNAIIAFLGFKDSEGDEAFGDLYGAVRPKLIVPIGYASAFNMALIGNTVFDGSGNESANPVMGAFDIIIANRLAAVGTTPVLYALLPNSPRSAFIHQTHTAVSLTNNSADVLSSNVSDLLITSASAHAVGYGDWRCAQKITIT